MTSERSAAGDSGRRQDGRFCAGNRIGKGNPRAKQIQQLRSAFLTVFTPETMRQVVEKLIEQALEGDIAAAKLLIDRSLGRESLAESKAPFEEMNLEERHQAAIEKFARLAGAKRR